MPQTLRWRDLPASVELRDLLGFIEFTNLFRKLERTLRITYIFHKGNERDGEHAFQLALVAWFMNERFKLGFDVRKIMCYALVHDLVETYAGETPLFPDPTAWEEPESRETKELREYLSLEQITGEWKSRFPEMIEFIEGYEERRDGECIFVYALDKLLPALNVTTDGGRGWNYLGVSIEDVEAGNKGRVDADPFIADLFAQTMSLVKEWRTREKWRFPQFVKTPQR